MPEASRARAPKTTMTAIAQRGNDDPPFPLCMLAEGLGTPDVVVGPAVADDREAAIAEEREAAIAEETEAADDAAAADVEDMDAATESAKVVSELH